MLLTGQKTYHFWKSDC